MKKLFGYLSVIVLMVSFIACGSSSRQRYDVLAKSRVDAVVEYNSNTSPISIEALGAFGSSVAFSLKKDGVEYIIITGKSTQGGVTVIKHTPVVKQVVNMDSVVVNSPWIEEYTMLGYTQAEPSKESLESLTNPEVRPVPVGSEEAFREYHTDVTDVSLVFQSMVL